MFGPSNYVSIRNWLHTIGVAIYSPKNVANSFFHHFNNVLSGRYLHYYKWQIIKILPRSVINFYYKTIKKRTT